MRRTILILALIGGVGAAAGSIVAALALGALALFTAGALEGQVAILVTFAFALATVAPALGVLVAWRAGRGLAGAGNSSFPLRRWGLWLLLFAGVLLLGLALVETRVTAALPFFHIVASVVATLMILSIPLDSSRRNDRRVGLSEGIGGLAWGGLGGIGLAMVVELALLVGGLVSFFAVLATFAPDSMQQIQETLNRVLTSGAANPRELMTIASSPWVVIIALLAAAVAVPLIEELAKSLAVPILLLTGRRLTRLEAFLVGSAAGAGFALLEGIFNGAMALESPDNWGTTVIARVGTTVIHVIASALAGVGWHGLANRRWLKALLWFGGAVALHGGWNGAVILLSWLSLAQQTGTQALPLRGFENLTIAALGVFIALLVLGGLVLLAWLPSRLEPRSVVQPPDGELR